MWGCNTIKLNSRANTAMSNLCGFSGIKYFQPPCSSTRACRIKLTLVWYSKHDNYSGYKCVHLLRIYVCIAAMSFCICPESVPRLQIRVCLLLVSLILLSLLLKSCMRNVNKEFLSESEMRNIEDIMTARYQLNTEVCKNNSRVRILSRPNGRFLKRLRCVLILF